MCDYAAGGFNDNRGVFCSRSRHSPISGRRLFYFDRRIPVYRLDAVQQTGLPKRKPKTLLVLRYRLSVRGSCRDSSCHSVSGWASDPIAPNRSGFFPFPRFYVELHFSRCAHPHQVILHCICAFTAGIEQLLNCIHAKWLVEYSQNIVVGYHGCRSFSRELAKNITIACVVLLAM